jgi:hypothetical protein
MKGVTAVCASDSMVNVEVGGNYVDQMRGHYRRHETGKFGSQGETAGQK